MAIETTKAAPLATDTTDARSLATKPRNHEGRTKKIYLSSSCFRGFVARDASSCLPASLLAAQTRIALRPLRSSLAAAALICAAAASASAQGPLVPAPTVAIPVGPAIVDEYVIGPDDVLVVQFWREKDLSAEVTVRPDGKVSLPLLSDVRAAGLTPEQLRDALNEAARKYIEDPIATVTVKQVNSRKVFITGQVEKPGPYPLIGRMTVLQLIATAGGLKDYVDGKNISVVRNEGGLEVTHRFNYQDALKRRNLRQNIELKAGDTVLVP
jgi:polysaccharide biosynthesis/export protein